MIGLGGYGPSLITREEWVPVGRSGETAHRSGSHHRKWVNGSDTRGLLGWSGSTRPDKRRSGRLGGASAIEWHHRIPFTCGFRSRKEIDARLVDRQFCRDRGLSL